MRASRQNETFTIILFFIGGFVGSVGIWFGWLISVGALYWYFKHGQKAKGWIGPNLEEMKKELAEIEDQVCDLSSFAKLTPKETNRLENRRRDLYEGIDQASCCMVVKHWPPACPAICLFLERSS